MKLKFFIILMFTVACFSIIYTTLQDSEDTMAISPKGTDAYSFPIRPGTQKWKALAYTERVEACQIPSNTLKAMSTEGLAITVLNCPLYMNAYVYNTPQQGFEVAAKRFNGLSELLKRKDSGIELLKRYKGMNPSDIKKNWNEEQKFLFVQTFDDIEILLCQNEILDDFSDKELKDLFLEAKDKYEKKQQSETFSILKQASAARLIGKVMEHAEFKQFKEELIQSKELRDFLQNGGFPAESVLTKIETYAEKGWD